VVSVVSAPATVVGGSVVVVTGMGACVVAGADGVGVLGSGAASGWLYTNDSRSPEKSGISWNSPSWMAW